MTECSYGRNEEVIFYDRENGRDTHYQCPHEAVNQSSASTLTFCRFHSDNNHSYWSSDDIMDYFDGLIHDAIKDNAPLACIGFTISQRMVQSIIDKNFANNIYFHESKFIEKTNLQEFTFLSDVDFSYCTFEDESLFEGSRFEKTANFLHVDFKGYSDFSESKFLKYANFTHAEFFNEAHFSDVYFKNNVDFIGVDFHRWATFFDTGFSTADFSSSTFMQEATFNSVRANEIIFDSVNFNTSLAFKEARIQKASFRLTHIEKVACKGTRFEDVVFEEATLVLANFNKTVFNKAQYINCTIIEAEFIDIRLIQIEKFVQDKDIYNINKMLNNKARLISFLENNTNFSYSEKHVKIRREDKKLHLSQIDTNKIIANLTFKDRKHLEVEIIETQQLYKFHRKLNDVYANINYIPITFDYTTIKNRIRFIGMDEKKPLLLEAVSFKGVDLSNVEFHHVQWLKSKDFLRIKNMVIDERVLGVLRTGEDVSKIYHQLRKNYETSLRFDEASDFFIGEMESVRKSMASSGHIGKLRSSVYWLYKQVGLYGESIFRPLVVLTPFLIMGFALWRFFDCDIKETLNYFGINFEECTPNPNSNLITYTIDSIAAYFQFPTTQHHVDVIERIVSIPILGATFVALRRKLERTK